ncbi:MAG: ankyrin repeat domain-containing protein [Rickettsia endosymbiont of Oxypoda opaca]|nr:ankyrin repeat domain-containing protein [Rickettsia endosymbiont of Oxypoda opaca]
MINIDKNGNTALTFAAVQGLEKVCEILIPKMTEQAINVVTKAGETALTYAAGEGLEKVCELLIPKMTEQAINQVTNNDDTVLSLFQQNGFKNIYNLLNLKTNEQNNQIKKTNVEKNLAEDVFEKIAYEINVKIANNATINAKDKSIMEDTIKDIINKAQLLNNTIAIEKITTNMQKLIVDKPTKLQLMTIEDQIDKLLEPQNINDDVTILGVDSTI